MIDRAGTTLRIAIVAMALCLVPPGDANAFGAEHHERYVHEAMPLYEQCRRTADRSTRLAADVLDAVANGTRAEDETELFLRITNWHYARTPLMPSWALVLPLPIPMNTDLGHIFRKRIGQLDRRRADPKAVATTAGRILHYLQDMRVPAHVIPVHHGALWPSDAFDDNVFRVNPPVFDEARCMALRAEAKRAFSDVAHERLAAAQRETRARMNTPLRPGAGCSWAEAFWCIPTESRECPGAAERGFGAYRRGAAPFGEPQVLECNGALYRLGRDDYDRFFQRGYERMMEDIVFIFFVVERRAEVRASVQ